MTKPLSITGAQCFKFKENLSYPSIQTETHLQMSPQLSRVAHTAGYVTEDSGRVMRS